MKEFIDKLIGRLEERIKSNVGWEEEPYFKGENMAYEDAISIVNQLAEEYNGYSLCKTREFCDYQFLKDDGWIPCEKDLPKISNSYLVTKMCENDGNPIYDTAHEVFWTSDGKWDCERDPDCEWKVTAWQNKIAPYQPEGEPS